MLFVTDSQHYTHGVPHLSTKLRSREWSNIRKGVPHGPLHPLPSLLFGHLRPSTWDLSEIREGVRNWLSNVDSRCLSSSLAPAGDCDQDFRNVLLPCIRDASTLPSRRSLYHTPQTLVLIGQRSARWEVGLATGSRSRAGSLWANARSDPAS